MKFSVFILAILVTHAVCGQQPYKVFDWKSEATINTYLLQRVHQQYDQRRARLQQALTSESAARAYRDSSRIKYKQLLGSLPEKAPLNSQITGVIKKDGYQVEKIIYESIPNHHVTANLYVPFGKGPFPGVLLFCGHEAEAKATPSYQKTAILFAKNGFVVLIIDPISQGERYQLTDATGKPLTRGGTTEHTLVNAAANLVGSSAVAYELWDNVRGLDYLVTRPEVDKERIGCLGSSGGGTQTSYFIGFDERIKVAAPCSYIASRERNLDLIGASDGCQHVMAEGEAQLEMNDFLIMFAPKPVLILAGRYDFVEYTGTTLAYAELQRVYSALKSPDKVKLFTAEDGHGISKPKREAVVTWFRKWLYKDSTSIKEPDLQTLTPSDLACTSSGQVNSVYANEINDFKRPYVNPKVGSNQQALTERIKQVLGITKIEGVVEVEANGSIDRKDYKVNKVIVRKPELPPLPVLTINPGGVVKEIVVWLSDKGKYKMADSTTWIKKYLQEQKAVVLADLSGLGETEDPLPFNDPKYFNKEYRNAMIALHAGTSMVALRTNNVLQLLDFISQEKSWKNIPVQIHADGVSALSVLHAAVIDRRITNIQLSKTISSFTEVFADPMRKDWYSYVVPGVLQYYDIRDLRKSIPDKLVE
jgi:hypothetical protein